MSTIIDDLIFDRTNANLVKGDPKGKYDYRDYNRVEQAAKYVADTATSKGYTISITTKRDWQPTDVPRSNDMTRYTNNVKTIIDALYLDNSLPNINTVLTILGANQIEKALYDAYDIAYRIMQWNDVDSLNETWNELDAKQSKWNEFLLKSSS